MDDLGASGFVFLPFLVLFWLGSGVGILGAEEDIRKSKNRFDFPSLYEEKRLPFEEGMTLNYVDHGQGPVVLFLHGLAADHHQWNDNMPALAGKYRILAIDFPGHGKSDRVCGYPYGIPTFSRCVIRLLDHLGIQRATLVGNSMGGHVALYVALHHPDRVDRLVLVDTAGTVPLSSWKMKLVRLVRETDAVRLATPRITRWLTPLVIRQRRECAITREMRAKIEFDRRDPRRKKDLIDCLDRCLKSIQENALGSSAREIEHPALIVWGTSDLLMPFSHALRLHRRLPRSRLSVYPFVGHVPSVEVPERFNRELLRFCPGK